MFEDDHGVSRGSAASAAHPPPGDAGDLAGWIAVLAGMPVAESEAEAVDRVRVLEGVKAACAAAQARETEAFRRMRCAAEAEAGVPVRERGRGVASEVALARRESPHAGSKDVGLARALVAEMPHTMAALTQGHVSEWKATVVCRETAWLPVEARREVDAALADRLASLGVRALGGEARRLAQQLDPASAVAQTDRCERERRVSVRPAPGGMAYLTALLPMRQAVACRGSLTRAAATTTGVGAAAQRTQDQVMADLLVERVTGQESADAVPVEVHLVMTDQALFGIGAASPHGSPRSAGFPSPIGPPNPAGPPDLPHPESPDASEAADPTAAPAWLVGHGPVPAATARRWLAGTAAQVFLRRLFTAPDSGQLVGMDARRREFSGLLRRMVILREDTCRTPWCDAPVKHIDHAVPFRHGGATSFENGSGLCERCNYTKENPGWDHAATAERLTVRTPTGHAYPVHTGPLVPGPRPRASRPH